MCDPQIIFNVISAFATAVMAVFAWKTWEINSREHKLYSPELEAYSWPEPKPENLLVPNEKTEYICYSLVFVNSGKVPIILNDIKEKINFIEKGEKISLGIWNFCQPPSERPVGVYINQFPWVIKDGSFAICERKLEGVRTEDLKGKKIEIRILVRYYSGKTLKEKEFTAPPRLGYTMYVCQR